jgi:hypothetical protein
MKDAEARRAAIALLGRGVITLPEAQRLAGVSRQLVRYWATRVRWKQVRDRRIAALWRKEMNRGCKVEFVGTEETVAATDH